jgi:large subunit ribosomal protein L18
MLSQKELHTRRKSRLRFKLKQKSTGKMRLCVNRTNQHIYAQIIDDKGASTLVAVSTVAKDVKSQLKNGSNKQAASLVGKLVAEAAKKKGIEEVVFDRSGYLYHGRIKALADSARENGLKF